MCAGFATGVTLSLSSHPYVYMMITNSFVRPHYDYRKAKIAGGITEDHAININMLDNYVKDVVKSFFTFWILIGPTIYKAHIQKIEDEDEED